MAVIDKEKIIEDEKRVKKLFDEFNDKLITEVKGRPYLLVLATLYEVERQGDSSKMAGQWNWRSNIYDKEEGRKKVDIEAGRKMMGVLVEQLDDAVNRDEIGVKKKYKL